MSRLAEIYLNEKSSGRGLGSTLGKRFLEKADPRRMFDRSGLLATMLPSLFKSYSATSGGKRNISSLGGRGSSINSPSFSIIGVESKLDDIYISNKMIAKNSMVLPSMHRDINLMRQNISKLVKLQGGNPASKADMFFTRAKDREDQYESQFKKEKSTTGKSASGATSAGGGGLLNMLFGGLGKIGEGIGTGAKIGAIGLGIGTGAKIGAIGLGIAGFIGSVGFASKFVDAQKLKDVLVAIGTGLGSFNMQTLVSLGSLVAAGTLFGAVAAFPGGMGKSIKGSIGTSMGMTAIGVGLAGFVGAIGLVAESIDIRKFSDLMMAISTSLNSFNTSSLVALGGLLAAGGIFGVVTAVNPLMGALGALGTTMGIVAIGWGLSSFIKTMAETVVFAEKLGVGNSIANLIIQVSKGLESLTNLNGANIANVGTGLAGLGTGLLALFGAKGLGAVEDTWIKVKKFFFPDSGDKKGFFDELIPELKKLEQLDDVKIRSVGDGFKNLVDNIKELTKLTDNDVDKVIKLTSAITTPYYGTSPAPTSTTPYYGTSPAPTSTTSGKSTSGSIVGNVINTTMGTLGILSGGAGKIVSSVGGYFVEKIINSNTFPWRPTTNDSLSNIISQMDRASGLTGGSTTSPTSITGSDPVSHWQALQAQMTSPTSATGSDRVNNLMNLIGSKEGGRMGYDAANRGRAGDTPNGMPGLSNMTVGQVMQMQSAKQLLAAGRYQITPDTLKGLVRRGVVSPNDIFNSNTQDKLFRALYNDRIRRAGNDPIKQQYELSQEWAVLANPYTNISYHAGKGNNRAGISTLQYNQATGGASMNSISVDNQSGNSSGTTVVNNYISTQNSNNSQVNGGSSTVADVADESLLRELIRKRPVQPII